MRLCYRGINYDYCPIEIQVGKIFNSDKFGGNIYQLGQEDLVYRGGAVRSETRQTRFLGQICIRNSLALEILGKPTRFLGRVRNHDFATQIDTFARVIV